MVVVREHEAGVVDDHVAFALEDRHVLADGVQAAQRDNLETRLRVLACGRGVLGSRALALLAFLLRRAVARQLRALALELNVLVRARRVLAFPFGLRRFLGLLLPFGLVLL